MFEILRRDAGQSSRTEPLIFTERELNAFLAQHLEESERIPFAPLVLKLDVGTVEMQGKTHLKALLRGIPFNYLAELLPAAQANSPVWVTIRGKVRLEHGRVRKEREFLRIEPTTFRIGDLEAGTWFLSWMLGPRLLRWPVPKVIEEVSVEEDRVVVTTRSG